MEEFEKPDGEKSFAYYCSPDGVFLPYRKHRILPLPEHQGQIHSCLAHAAVNCLESRIRIQQGEQHLNKTPRLSIQHCVDACLHPATAFTEGVSYKTILNFLRDEGVTTAKMYQFEGGVQDNRFDMGPVFLFSACEPRTYPKKRTAMKKLLRSLEVDGPFIGSFFQRTSHAHASLLTLAGDVILKENNKPFKHAVLIIGHKIEWGENEEKPEGYWVYMEAKGPDWRGCGFNRIAVDALDKICVPTVDLNYCEFNQLRRGLAKKIMKAGDGPSPVWGQFVQANWTGFVKSNDKSRIFYSME